MIKKTNSILVVGAGTAGLVTALILKQKYKENLDIEIIKSDKVGIIGVGEGSTEHWSDFLDFIGVEKSEIIKECGATFKFGINFKEWGSYNYIHNVNEYQTLKNAGHFVMYNKMIAENKPLVHNFVSQNKYPADHIENIFVNQFHFDTHKLNDYLQKLCIERGMRITDDEIIKVELDKNNGNIKMVKSEENYYTADFFIDCTGFKRLLINELGGEWESYEKYLKMKQAIVFPTPEEDNYNMWTEAKAMKHGWRFKIPVQGRCGNGYIYDSDYTTSDKAKQEIEKDLGFEVDVKKQISFQAGALKKTWIKNCVAVGLSANFIEPLEASSIGSSIRSAYVLSQHIISYDERAIDYYNQNITSINENIRDFVALHYVTDRDDSKFWQDQKDVPLPDTLKSKLDLWKTRLPCLDDFRGDSGYILFWAENFMVVMDGLNMIDKDMARHQYNMLNNYTKQYCDFFEADRNETIKKWTMINHKDAIKLIL